MNLTKTAKTLRRNSTDAERLLWKHLKTKQLENFKFRRQQPLGQYIVDFVCFEKGIIIEADRGQHAEEKEKDQVRDEWLKSQGFEVIRFWNNDILVNIEGVMETIRDQCLNHPPLNPLPSREGK